jgi:hypothetical protein
MKIYFYETEVNEELVDKMVNGKTDELNKQSRAKSSEFYLYRLGSKSGFHLFKLAQRFLFVATKV